MSSFFMFLNVGMVCMTLLGVAFMVVLSLPQSHMRDVMKHVLFAVACLIYVFSPIDLIPEVIFGPFGLIDDLGAIVAGIMSARKAMHLAA